VQLKARRLLYMSHSHPMFLAHFFVAVRPDFQ